MTKLKYIDLVCKHGVAPRKISVKCSSHHRQGISLSSRLKTRIDFEKTCGMDRFCNSVPKNSENDVLGIFLSKPQAWYIITTQSWISSALLGLYLITRQRASICGLMIYNAPHWWYTRLWRDFAFGFESLIQTTWKHHWNPTASKVEWQWCFLYKFLFYCFHLYTWCNVWHKIDEICRQ